MEQLSLFQEDSSKEPKKNIPKENSESETILVYKKQIIDYIEQGLSVRELCEKLIENHGALNERYSQGTPKIYPEIMQLLRSLNNVKMIEIDRAGHGKFTKVEDIDSHSSIKDAKFALLK